MTPSHGSGAARVLWIVGSDTAALARPGLPESDYRALVELVAAGIAIAAVRRAEGPNQGSLVRARKSILGNVWVSVPTMVPRASIQ